MSSASDDAMRPGGPVATGNPGGLAVDPLRSEEAALERGGGFVDAPVANPRTLNHWKFTGTI